MGQTPKPRSARPSALPGRCLSADRVPAAQPWGRGGSGAGAAASPAARARSAAPGRPRLQPEPDSRRRRRHLRLLPREGGGPPARKPGPRGVASRARLAPLYSMNYLHGSHIHLPPSRCFPIPPVLKISLVPLVSIQTCPQYTCKIILFPFSGRFIQPYLSPPCYLALLCL